MIQCKNDLIVQRNSAGHPGAFTWTNFNIPHLQFQSLSRFHTVDATCWILLLISNLVLTFSRFSVKTAALAKTSAWGILDTHVRDFRVKTQSQRSLFWEELDNNITAAEPHRWAPTKTSHNQLNSRTGEKGSRQSVHRSMASSFQVLILQFFILPPSSFLSLWRYWTVLTYGIKNPFTVLTHRFWPGRRRSSCATGLIFMQMHPH